MEWIENLPKCRKCGKPFCISGDSMAGGNYLTHVVHVGDLYTEETFDIEYAYDKDHEPQYPEKAVE